MYLWQVAFRSAGGTKLFGLNNPDRQNEFSSLLISTSRITSLIIVNNIIVLIKSLITLECHLFMFQKSVLLQSFRETWKVSIIIILSVKQLQLPLKISYKYYEIKKTFQYKSNSYWKEFTWKNYVLTNNLRIS